MASKVMIPTIKKCPQYGEKERYVRLIHRNAELLGHFEAPAGEIYDAEFRQAGLLSLGAYQILEKLREKYPL